jgi:polysaccharide chain length determinant protein (PEP-CTERM system associated)
MISIHEQINVIYGYLHGLWRYRWSALFISWLVAIAGWAYIYSLPDQYSAKAAVHIDTSSVMQPLLRGLAVETNPEEEINVMTRILLSRENLLTVIRETDMDLGVDSPAAREGLVQRLSNGIRIDNLGGSRNRSSIYEISYKSTSAEMAFKVVFNLLNTLIENTLNSGRMDTVMAEEFLNDQIQDYEQRLLQGEQRLAEFKKKNVGFMPDEKGGYYARLRRQQELIDGTQSGLRLAKQRYREISQQLSGEKPVISTSTASANKLRNYQAQLDGLLTQYTEEHPDVMSLRATIKDLRERGQGNADDGTDLELGDTGLNPIYQDLKVEESRARVDVGTLQVKLAEQRQKLAELKKSIDIIPQVEADLVKLNRDYDITKERYLSLVERRESARMAQKVEQNNSELIFRVVDAPVVPLLPNGPNRPIYLIGVFLAALAAGVGWSILRFLLYPTFVDFKQMQKMIDLPILGTISLQATPEKTRQRRLDVTTFLLVALLMFGSFVAAVLYQQQGSVQIRMLLSLLGI